MFVHRQDVHAAAERLMPIGMRNAGPPPAGGLVDLLVEPCEHRFAPCGRAGAAEAEAVQPAPEQMRGAPLSAPVEGLEPANHLVGRVEFLVEANRVRLPTAERPEGAD